VTFQITANGRTRAVEVSRTGDTFHVSLDGRQHEVDVKLIDGVLSLLIGTRSYEISMGSAAPDGSMRVHVDGTPVEVVVAASRPSWSSRGGAVSHSTAEGPQRVSTPMPGKIVKLLVKPGDTVEPRQGLVVVEAMKMENELRARAAGTVTEVCVKEGASVEAGAILVVIE
jgi:biotin carboxyl carrier protein